MGSVNVCHVLDGGSRSLSDVSTAIFTKWYNRLCTQLKMLDFKCTFKNTGKPDKLLDKKSSMMPGHHFGLEASAIVSRTILLYRKSSWNHLHQSMYAHATAMFRTYRGIFDLSAKYKNL